MQNLHKYQHLAAAGEVDAILLTSRWNRRYAAEYDIAEGFAVICAEQGYYFTDSRYIEAAKAHLPEFTVVQTERGHREAEYIQELVEKHELTSIGFEEDALTYGEFLRLKDGVSARLIPAQAKIDAFRAAKEPWELERMRTAQAITDEALAKILPFLRAGVTEKAIQRELDYLMTGLGADGPAFETITISGPNTSMPHGVPGMRKVCDGDFITMDFGASYQGYCADMTRTVAIGHVTEEMRNIYQIVLRAQLAGLAVTRAGITGNDLDATARRVIEDAGYGAYFTHGYGHGVGLLLHEAPFAGKGCTQPLMESAVVSAEPGIYLPGRFGVRIEDTAIIGKDGCEILGKSPKELLIL